MQPAPVFEESCNKPIADVAPIDVGFVSNRLGIEIDDDTAIIPFFGIPHRVSGKGVINARDECPIDAPSVILCKYLPLCFNEEPPARREWVKYCNFRDVAPFAGGFRNSAEQPISKAFSGQSQNLKKHAWLWEASRLAHRSAGKHAIGDGSGAR